MSGDYKRCGECGGFNISGEWGPVNHFPDCSTIQDRAAGIEVTPAYSNELPRRCPRCGSRMTRNHDQQSDTYTDNCTGAVCGATVEVPRAPDHARQVVMPPDPTSPAAAFDAIAAMPGAQVIEEPYPGEGELCEVCKEPLRPETGNLYVQDGERFYHAGVCWESREEP